MTHSTESTAALLATRGRLIGPSLSVGYRQPLHLVRGTMQYLFDSAGRRYLDAYNNVPHVGHCHPQVVRAATEQLALLNTNTRYLHENLEQFAAALTATLPEPLRVCYFVNSGSEANELALRLARTHTRATDLIVLDAAYHGNTTTLIDISPYKANGPGGQGCPPWVHVAPLADVYRGQHKSADPQAGTKYAQALGDHIGQLAADRKPLCGYIAESCPSVGGQIVFPDGYLAAVYALVRAAGGVCIADEVQTAYGRLGNHFYGFEQQRVVPDIVVFGKPIGNGYPLGAVVTTAEIAASFNNGMEFFSTFGGSTVSCAVGAAVLEIVNQDGLQAHALKVGAHLLSRLRVLATRHELIGDVRGSGLFLGVELVGNRATLAPAAHEAAEVVNRMREAGVLIGTDGPYHNVLKIRPPLPFGIEDADVLVECLDQALAGLASNGG
ncbi:MAG: aminotransferase class III-fold pyridoxal phosphate-dependent enzyme [Steroidobacteraceae bacterium]